MTSRRRFSKEDGYSAAGLVHTAKDHLYSAALLYDVDVRTLDSAAYLAHLALELLLKAVLLERDGQFSEGHSLVALAGIADLRLPPPHDGVLTLIDRFAKSRYPDPGGLPSVAQGDWPVINQAAELILNRLPVDVRNTPDSAGSARKGTRVMIRNPSDVLR